MAAAKKVAIVCDWLVGTGGAERVVLELHRMYPEAPIYTSQYNQNPKIWYGDKWFEGADVRTGWLQKLPVSLRKFLPILRAWYFRRLDLSDYDLIISSSGAEAKAVKTPSGAIHISYIHAPTHYYWARYEEYLAHPGFGRFDFLAWLALKLLVGPLRHLDYKAAQGPDYLVANSNFTRDQIKKYYGREAVVIHPPVDIERFGGKSDEPRRGFVIAGRQTPYKRIDLAVQACSELNLPLLVIGNGPDHARLKRLAGKSVTFLRNVSDEQMKHYFQTSQAFIFPGIDDFGIVAVEALSAGTPVIAFGQGGALDYITKANGLLFTEQTVESLSAALQSFKPDSYDHAAVAKSAADFAPKVFRHKMTDFVNKSEVA